ncbi:hypothetical protein [Qipengyuania flava]|uniref:hypothetical protein n=1 Tax=Qipengyuania flava TaxID=192812 RepID=UPI001C634B3F|nr:hypothetical protein [Qipengyuania flava]QYJ08338.1 hypothetical protein KUV82_06495 [Qipengyuania flava]
MTRTRPIARKATARLAALLAASAMLASPLSAQQSRYEYCHERAVEFSGYTGPVPDKYKKGGLLEGAAQGAVTSGIGALIFGKNKKERRKAIGRGAIFGGIVGAIKRGNANREEKRIARIYRLELDACMGAAQGDQ